MLSITLRLLGVERIMDAQGVDLDLKALLVFAAVFGMRIWRGASIPSIMPKMWKRMGVSCRPAVQLAVLFLAVRVFVDLATPLLPGAFRLDPNESVVVVGASHKTAVNAATFQPPPITRQAACTFLGSSRSPVQPSQPGLTRHPCTFNPRTTYLAEQTASTPSPDDD